jgi:superfamily II DNA or RNA helicase
VIIGPVSGFTPRPYQEHCINGGDPRRGIGIMPAFARYKRVLAVMATGCHERGQPLMMADGSTRLVEDIQVGDLLMGPDLTPRTVLALARGRQEMARIVPHSPLGPVTAGKPWRVNLDHILTLTTSDPAGQPQMSENWVDISVRDYLAAPAHPWPLHLIRVHAHGDMFDPLTGAFTPRRHGGRRQHPRISTCAFTIEHCSVDDYYGFTLDGDHRYLLADGTVTHNCGKTETYLAVIRRYLESARTPTEQRAMLIAHLDELVSQPIERAPRFGLRFAREQGPDTAIGKPERAIASTIQSLTANRVRSAATALGYRFEKKRKKDPAQVELGTDPPKREKGDRFTVWSPAGAELGRFDIKEFTKLFKETHPGVPTCRMEEYDPNEIGLIVIDECHHAASDEMMKVLEYFIHAFVLGVTATPERLDGIGMEEVFEAVAYCYPIEQARPDGWLVDAYVSEHPIEGLDLTQLRKRAGDLPPEALGELMAEYSMPVAANIVRLAGDRPTIVFCATVAHAHSQAAALRRYTDERVEVADGGTAKDIRRDVVADFRAGAVRFLVNAMLWCLDDQTEILTRRGWLGIDALQAEDLVAQWSKDGSIRFAPPSRVIRRDREPSERMVSVAGTRMNIRVTENHRLAYKSTKVGRWMVRTAGLAVNRKCYLPVSGRALPEPLSAPVIHPRGNLGHRLRNLSYLYRKAGLPASDARALASSRIAERDAMTYKPPSELTEAECWLIGFWIGDGGRSRLHSGGVEYTMSQVARHQAIVARVDAALLATGIHFVRHVRPKNNREYVYWSMPRGTGFGSQKRNGVFHLEPYLDKAGSDLLWGLGRAQFDAFMGGLWNADGNHAPDGGGYQHLQVTSVERTLIDLLQAIATCRGYEAFVAPIPQPNPLHRLQWKLRWTDKREHQMVNDRLQFEPEWRAERVWCVTVDTGFIVTRRRGHVAVLGNCEGFDAPNASCIALVRPTCSRSLLLQCIGRGTRPEPGVVDRPELRNDPAGRVAAIATSNKPNLLVLDFTSQVKVVGLASPADVLAGRLTAEERLALAGIKLVGDKTIDEITREAIRLAAAAAAEAAALSDAVAEDAEVLDPWDPSIVMSMKLPRDDPREARCSPAQAAYLAKQGIEKPEAMSASRAKKLQGALFARSQANLCSYKQQLALQKAGIPPKTTTRMYLETACKLLDALVSNGWRRPVAWERDPRLGGRAPVEKSAESLARSPAG